MAPQVLHDLLKKIIKELNYEKPNVEIKSISSGGANYSSALYTIKVSQENKEDLHLFAKVAIIDEKSRWQIPLNVFDIERSIYLDLLKKYEYLQDKYNIPLEKRLIIPKYYGSNPKQFEEILVLENLIAKGFSMYDRFKSIDWNYASKSVEALARLHALSVAFKEEYPDEYNKFVDKMKPQVDFINNILKTSYEQHIKSTLEVTAKKNKDKLKKYLDTKLKSDVIFELIEKSKKRVLCHGDYRQGNLMYRINETGIIDLIPVDYQTITPNSPVTELLYFIFTGTDEKFRQQYFQELIDLYYEEFSSALRRLKIDPDTIYSKRDYELDVKEYLPYGLVIAIYGMPMITIEARDAPSMQDGGGLEVFNHIKIGPLYAERMNGVINDFIRWGVIE